MSAIKINKAAKLYPVLPMADQAMMADIPAELVASLTSRQLAEVKRAMTRHWHKAVAWAEAEAVGNGYVYSKKDDCLYDVVAPK